MKKWYKEDFFLGVYLSNNLYAKIIKIKKSGILYNNKIDWKEKKQNKINKEKNK